MLNFIIENQRIFWIIIVVLSTLFIHFLLRLTFNFLIKRSKKLNTNFESTLSSLKNISIVFTYVIGFMLACYGLLEKELHNAIGQNMLLVFWIAFVSFATVISVALSQRYFDSKIEKTFTRDVSDPTTYKFLNYFCTVFLYFLGVCLIALAIPSLRTMAQSALAGAGVLAIIGGVASQEAMSNLVGGLFIVFFKPFRIGDVVKVGNDIIGTVEDLTLRHTIITDFHNKRIIIPNSIINKEKLTNYNLGDRKTCEWIAVGISYDSDIDLAMKIMEEEAMNHPLCVDGRTRLQKEQNVPQVLVKVIGLGDSSVNLRAWVWARTYPEVVTLRHDLYKSIKERFDKEGIEIPFPHRTIVYKNKTVADSLQAVVS